MIFPGPFPFQNSAARRLAQWHLTATQLTHLTQRCEDVAVGARMPEPFAKAPVALSHRTASWLPRCSPLVSRESYQSCNHGTPHSRGPGLAKRNQQQSWSKPQVTAKVPAESRAFLRFVISNAPNTRLQKIPTHSIAHLSTQLGRKAKAKAT